MICVHDLENFVSAKCVRSKANTTFSAFHIAFSRWLGPDRLIECPREKVFELLCREQVLQIESINGVWHVINCAIPEDQVEMVSS